MRIYIDTSVINGLYTKDTEIKIITKRFFEYVKKNDAVLYSSDLIVQEVDRTPDESKRNKLKEALAKYDVGFLPYSDEIERMANIYTHEKIIPVKYLPDAVHIATASIHNIPILVS